MKTTGQINSATFVLIVALSAEHASAYRGR